MKAKKRLVSTLPLAIGIFLQAFNLHVQAAPQTTSSNSVNRTQITNHAHVETRLLLICAPSQSHVYVKKQLQLIEEAERALSDRDLEIVVITNDSAGAQKNTFELLSKAYHIQLYDFSVLLIDKDENIALKSGTPLSAQTLIQTIDHLPRRQAEIRWIES